MNSERSDRRRQCRLGHKHRYLSSELKICNRFSRKSVAQSISGSVFQKFCKFFLFFAKWLTFLVNRPNEWRESPFDWHWYRLRHLSAEVWLTASDYSRRQPMGDRYPSVTIQVQSTNYMSLVLSQANCPNMKPPKLPGTEKFKFSDKKYIECRKGSVNSDDMSSAIDSSNFIRGIPSRSTCPTSSMSGSLSSQTHFSRSDAKRKAILPITSHMTSRVLTLTNLPLDSFDIRDLHSSSSRYRASKSSGESRSPSNTASTSRVSLFSDCSGSQCSSSQPSPRSLCSPVDRSLSPLTPCQWAKDAHRLSTSSQSSWEDCPEIHEPFWMSRKK